MESKVIQEGSYGCVVSPPLKCKKSKGRPQRTVGKIIKTKNSKVELSIATLVKAIPGWSRYYVLQEDDDCDSKNFDAHREVYAKLCKVYGSSEDSQLSQLISPYAGSTVRSMALTPSFNFVGSLRHTLEGVSELNAQGICHYDLHDGNVLVDFRGTFRIIDFGAAFLGDSTDDAVVKKHTYVFSPEFQPEAPELSIQHGLSGGLQLTDALEQTMNRKKEFALAHRLIGLSAVAQRRELIEFWLHEDTWTGETWVNFYRKYWRKWDSWAIGVLFLHILSKSFLMPGFLREVWPIESERIKNVLKGLLRSNPNHRMTASEALKALE
jgi:serine/threonine protein kinase